MGGGLVGRLRHMQPVMRDAAEIGPYGADGIRLASLAFVQGGGILFPDWSAPTKGTYDNPAATVGKQAKKAQPWSVTTYTSAYVNPQEPRRLWVQMTVDF